MVGNINVEIDIVCYKQNVADLLFTNPLNVR